MWFIIKYCQNFSTSHNLIFSINPLLHYRFQGFQITICCLLFFPISELIYIKDLELSRAHRKYNLALLLLISFITSDSSVLFIYLSNQWHNGGS